MLKGVDTSHYEADFDWTAGIAAGLTFMMTKATEGATYVDMSAKKLVDAAAAAGIKYRGAYHFFHADQPVVAQVQSFQQHFSSLDLEMPPILDLEETSVGGVGYTQVKSAALSWLLSIQRWANAVPILYIDMNMYQLLKLAGDADFAGFPLWIAKYSVNPPHIPWTFWQFTDSGEQGADTNYFNGDEAALKKLCNIA